MTSCWIVYDRADLGRNEFFAKRMADRGRELGMECAVVTTDSLPEGSPDCAVNRSRDAVLARRLESESAVVVNPSGVTEVCNDKLLTYRMADAAGIPHLPVSLPGEDPPPGPPWVVKPRRGHGGAGVSMARDEAELSGILNRTEDAVVQTACPVLGRDLRAYVLDGEVLAWVMRSSDTDFRANRCLGGAAALHEPDGCEKDVVEAVSEALGPGFYGVDLLPTGDGPVLNEVEDAAGTRMLYELTDLDPARLLVEYAHSKISR